MTFDQLQSEVREKIKDISRRVDEQIPDFIHEACLLLADEVPLPKLKRFNRIWTQDGVSYADMPSDFGGRLTYVGDDKGRFTIVPGGIEGLLSSCRSLDLIGNNITDVAIEGDVLWYSPITPTTQLVVVYYANPTRMTTGGESPSYIPEQYHRSTILNKACELAFNIIEEGVEGDHVNTIQAANAYEVGKNKLWGWVYRSQKQGRVSAWDV